MWSNFCKRGVEMRYSLKNKEFVMMMMMMMCKNNEMDKMNVYDR
jgi:hypothetical protein